MSGHSKWATIKRTKGANDAKKGALFGRLSKDITIATKLGQSGDLGFNPLLRIAVDKAKAANMTNDKIENAINKGLGVNSGNEQLVENTYEINSPEGIPILVDCETDNPNRSITDIKIFINKNGGKLMSEGSVSWQFRQVGCIVAKIANLAKLDDLALGIMDVDGVEDLIEFEDEAEKFLRIIIAKEKFSEASAKIANLQSEDEFGIVNASLIMKAESNQEYSKEQINTTEEYIEKLEELDDVTNVWTVYNRT